MSIILLTDTHPTHLKSLPTPDWNATTVFIAGDWSDGKNFKQHAKLIRALYPRAAIFSVNGNHDYWGRYNDEHSLLSALYDERIHNIGGYKVAEGTGRILQNGTLILGQSGWYDHLDEQGNKPTPYYGDFMNDWTEIVDFVGHGDKIPRICYNWSRASAFALQDNLNKYLENWQERVEAYSYEYSEDVYLPINKVVILTHVPPFQSTDWRDNNQFFLNRPMGEVIKLYAENHPTVQFTVLCGHTHPDTPQDYRPEGNIRQITGAARYGSWLPTSLDGLFGDNDPVLDTYRPIVS